ncbi:MAG TPA: murein biosynthesis integral membrane protein MurJ, partial [Candidatus Ozemobacteraceae bacterium]|nr:murein biosynthesis integral membrane protein MurJ [Candidatus Ozemobacteraceae bacterium]
PEKYDTTVTMTRIMFPFLLEVSWAAVVMGMLNSFGSFFVPAIAPVFLNLAMIAAGFVLCPLAVWYGWPAIVGMAIGAMLGGFLQFLVQIPALWKMGFRPGWSWNLSDPGLQRIFALMIPGTIGMAATQINVVVSTWLATSQGTGAVSWLNYAFRLMQLPLGLFGVAIAQATLPVVSRQAADGKLAEMKQTLADSLRLTVFINLSASLALVACAEPIIRLLFEHGRFTPDDTLATAAALRAYAVGLLFFSVIKVMGPSFYALGDTRAPVRASLSSVVANVILNLALIGPLGYWGLALGGSLASGLNAGMLFWSIRRHLGGWSETGLFGAMGKTLICSTISSFVMYYSLGLLPSLFAVSDQIKLVRLLIEAGSLGIAGILD